MSQSIAVVKGKKTVVPSKPESQTATGTQGASSSAKAVKQSSSGRMPAHRQVILDAAQLGIDKMSLSDGGSQQDAFVDLGTSSTSNTAVDEYEAAKGKKVSKAEELDAERKAVADLDRFSY